LLLRGLSGRVICTSPASIAAAGTFYENAHYPSAQALAEVAGVAIRQQGANAGKIARAYDVFDKLKNYSFTQSA
jgi:hypothetical protein